PVASWIRVWSTLMPISVPGSSLPSTKCSLRILWVRFMGMTTSKHLSRVTASYPHQPYVRRCSGPLERLIVGSQGSCKRIASSGRCRLPTRSQAVTFMDKVFDRDPGKRCVILFDKIEHVAHGLSLSSDALSDRRPVPFGEEPAR